MGFDQVKGPGTPPASQPASPLATQPKVQPKKGETKGGEYQSGSPVKIEQASPPIISDAVGWLRLYGIFNVKAQDIGTGSREEVIKILEKRGIKAKEGITWEQFHKIFPQATRAYFDTLSQGSKGIDGDGKVTLDDVATYYKRVISDRIAQGVGSDPKVIEGLIDELARTEKFKMVDAEEWTRRLSEKFWNFEDGGKKLYEGGQVRVSVLLGNLINPKLLDMAYVVLSNLTHRHIDKDFKDKEDLKLTAEQFQNFLLTMYFLGKLDNPERVLVAAKDRPALENDDVLAWLSKDAKKQVPAEKKAEGAGKTGTEDTQKLMSEAQSALDASKYDEAVSKLEQAFDAAKNDDEKIKIAKHAKQLYGALIEALSNAKSDKLDDAVKAYEKFIIKLEKIEVSNDSQKGALKKEIYTARVFLANKYSGLKKFEDRIKAIAAASSIPDDANLGGENGELTGSNFKKAIQMRVFRNPDLAGISGKNEKDIPRLEEFLKANKGNEALMAHITLYEAKLRPALDKYNKKKYSEAKEGFAIGLAHIKEARLILKNLTTEQKAALEDAIDNFNAGIKEMIGQLAGITKQTANIPGTGMRSLRAEIRAIAKEAAEIKKEMEGAGKAETTKKTAKKAKSPHAPSRPARQAGQTGGKGLGGLADELNKS